MGDSNFLYWALPLGSALIGALAAIVGNAVSPLFTARKAHQQWLRDRRVERFEQLWVLAGRAVQVVRSSQHYAQKDIPDGLAQELADAAAALEMWASPATGQAAADVVKAYEAWVSRCGYETPPADVPAIPKTPDNPLGLATIEDGPIELNIWDRLVGTFADHEADFFAKATRVRSLIRTELEID